jgi:integrase
MSIPHLDKADNGVFYAKWTDGRRSKRRSMGTRDAATAQARFAQWLLIGGNAERPAEPTKVYTVAQLWGAYQKGHVDRKVISLGTHDWTWRNLREHFASLTLDRVSDAVPGYVEKRERGQIGRPAKSATIRRELALLRACFNWCACPKERKPLIGLADVPGFALPAESQPRDRWLKEDEIARLLAAARDGERLSRVERFLWLALETAGRKQALLDLTWDRVDFETNVIHLALPGRKQTKKRRASVPISKALRPVLERAYAERAGERVLDHGGEVWGAVQAVVRRAGLAPKIARPTGTAPTATGISPHVMRHTAATHMARRGVPLFLVAKILGDTIATVEKSYAKHAPDDLRAAVDMISGK